MMNKADITSKIKELDCAMLNYIELIDDNHAEVISGGAFTWDTGRRGESGTTGGSNATISLRGATELSIINTNSNSDSEFDSGHNFGVAFYTRDDERVGGASVIYGDGIRGEVVENAIARGATEAVIAQGPFDSSSSSSNSTEVCSSTCS